MLALISNKSHGLDAPKPSRGRLSRFGLDTRQGGTQLAIYHDIKWFPVEASMSYAEILVAMGDDELAYQRAAYAAGLAGHLNASILGVMSRWPRPPQIDPRAAIGMVSALLAGARTSCRLELAAVEARFRKTVGTSVNRVLFAGEIGSMTEAVLREARRADLIVIGQSAPPGEDRGPCDAQVLLTRSGRPVMVVPPAYRDPVLPRHIMVAWRDCRASRRVLREALPLLLIAQQVSVVCLDGEPSAGASVSTADIANFLQGHGVLAKTTTRGGPAPLRELLTALGEDDVDLLVAPAYCSNQLARSELVRQTTRMLTRCRIPCILAN